MSELSFEQMLEDSVKLSEMERSCRVLSST